MTSLLGFHFKCFEWWLLDDSKECPERSLEVLKELLPDIISPDWLRAIEVQAYYCGTDSLELGLWLTLHDGRNYRFFIASRLLLNSVGVQVNPSSMLYPLGYRGYGEPIITVSATLQALCRQPYNMLQLSSEVVLE